MECDNLICHVPRVCFGYLPVTVSVAELVAMAPLLVARQTNVPAFDCIAMGIVS